MNTARWNLNPKEQESLGKSIRLVTTPVSSSTPAQQTWFQGNEKYFNVTILSSEGEVTWIQITLRGFFLEWKDGRLTWGQTTEYAQSVNMFPSAQLLVPEREFDQEFVQAVLGVLKNSPKIELIEKATELIESDVEVS